MLTKRIIPCLDVKDGRVVKGVNFVDLVDKGDPAEHARRYDEEGADEIVYDKDAKSQNGQDTQVDDTPMSDAEVRALWLKRVQTKPADFLRARFAYQLQVASAQPQAKPAEPKP